MRRSITILLGSIVVLLLVAVLMLFQSPASQSVLPSRSYSQVIGMGTKLKSAVIRGDELDGRDATGERFVTHLPHDIAIADRLTAASTGVFIAEPSDDRWATTLATSGLPLLAYAAIWLYPLLRIARALEGLLARSWLAQGTRATRGPRKASTGMDAGRPSA